MNSSATALLGDVLQSVAQWRFWLRLGWNDIARQYRRSFLGPVWITLNTGFFIVAFGLVGAQLFKADVRIYLPYFALRHVVFSFFSSVLIEGCQAFVIAEPYLKHAASPKLSFVFRGVVRNLVTLAHNAVIVVGVLLWAGAPRGVNFLDLVAGLLLVAVAACLAMGIVGVIAARFRDVPMIVSSVMQVLFFVTPVMWRPDQLTERAQWLVHLNPFAVFLELIRYPLLGQALEFSHYLKALGVIGVLLLLFVPLLSWARARIVYWL